MKHYPDKFHMTPEQFNTLLLDYYNTGESEKLKDFLYENTIQGIA